MSGIHVDNKDNPTPTVNKRAYSGSFNLIWTPITNMNFGIEFMRGYRELENGTRGKFDRMQFSAQYAFSFSASTN